MVKRLLAAACVSLMLGAVRLSADDLNVVVDPKADFSKFRTFSFRVGKIESARPEIDNPLYAARMTKTIRAALATKGLKEIPDRPDLFVEYSIASEDVNTTQRGGGRGIGPQPLRFTVGMLVIDMTRPGDHNPVWRGVYRDDEMTGSKLAQKLPEDAKKLIAKYKGVSD
jgi:hypothetical protein